MAINVNELSTEQLEAVLKERQAQQTEQRNKAREAYESLKDEVLTGICNKATVISENLQGFKLYAFSEMDALDKLLKEYSKRHADGKGNFTVENTESTLRIKYSIDEIGDFDERSKQAEAHIKEFIESEFEDANPLKELVNNLIERKKGSLDIKLVQRLYGMEDKFENENWKEGIRLLKESWKSTGTRHYLRIYKKNEQGEWNQIPLNFSSI